ncbi:glycerophosphodiester phosphodiesterase [Spirochaeta africana]|uniref:Glycerophosphoryl diester phosphodiesterase n=1 Tax=Spirochaeta africana (strain ATCC 700263 / DSM 8902 / Z-7692) TaxID=889378 RepID=H9UMH2_SPIAZ|nr:glycerophosphodiester phosphodiesterase [Spirochaeta africana]AFG38715.1 glycerophosphoryl diester phosphodiesterase [Spirochaeta africana DSM 8902]
MTKPRIIAAAVAAVIIGIYLFAALRPAPDARTFFRSLPQDRTLVIAHRGGAEIFPENTLYAFRRADDLGADILEMDVHATADGVPVVIHDETVDRTTNGSGLVSSFTLEELQQLDAGYWFEQPAGSDEFPYRYRDLQIPTLREVFQAFPDAHMIVETKENNPALAAAMIELVQEYGREERTMLASFHHEMLVYFREHLPTTVTHASSDEVIPFLIASWLRLEGLLSPQHEAFVVPIRHGRLPVITRRFLAAADARGLATAAWTINTPEQLLQLAEKGAWGLITDRPDLAHTIVRQAGLD